MKRTRELMVEFSMRWKNIQCADYLDHWFKCVMEESAATHMTRIVRGFLARRRRIFVRSLNRRVLKLQAQARQLHKKIKFRRVYDRRRWAVTTIQRMVRGHHARRRVMG